MEARSVIEVVEYDEASVPGLAAKLTDRARADRGLSPVPVWEE